VLNYRIVPNVTLVTGINSLNLSATHAESAWPKTTF